MMCIKMFESPLAHNIVPRQRAKKGPEVEVEYVKTFIFHHLWIFLRVYVITYMIQRIKCTNIQPGCYSSVQVLTYLVRSKVNR